MSTPFCIFFLCNFMFCGIRQQITGNRGLFAVKIANISFAYMNKYSYMRNIRFVSGRKKEPPEGGSFCGYLLFSLPR